MCVVSAPETRVLTLTYKLHVHAGRSGVFGSYLYIRGRGTRGSLEANISISLSHGAVGPQIVSRFGPWAMRSDVS